MKNEISVNMTPNPLDYQTLHCSQNDTTLRKFKFTLHNQGEAVDTSSISDPVFSSFNEYEGGTEELLPTNTSTPSTSPILADIQYSDGLREDQSFTYRESPVTKDGKAKVNVLKGNSLVWNQLANNSNPPTDRSGLTFTIDSDGFTINGTATSAIYAVGWFGLGLGSVTGLNGHKALTTLKLIKGTVSNLNGVRFSATSNNTDEVSLSTGSNITTLSTTSDSRSSFAVDNGVSFTNAKIVAQIFDLTAMGLDSITSVDEFTSLFPLPYYPYDTGSMLDFKGTGIKTVGFNQWDEEWEIGGYSTSNGTKQVDNSRIRSTNFIRCLPNTSYVIKSPATIILLYYDASQNYLNYVGITNTNPFTTPENACYMAFYVATSYGTTYKNDICINISDPSKNGTYEPYKESSLSLPVSQYFPTGMKSAGNVYDELTSNKAVTRVGQVDLGTLTWSYLSAETALRFFATLPSDAKNVDATVVANAITSKYPVASWNSVAPNVSADKMFALTSTYITIRDTSYTDATAFKASLSGVMLNYELATPSEQSITSASLVTINGESDLYTDGEDLVCDCNEDISKESGYFDAKLRFTDADGTNYSNKFELHVERSPQ